LDINLAVMQAVAGLRILADQKGITLTSRPAEGLDTILGDVGRLARLTQNLVSNAVKFTPKGGAVLVETRPCARRRNRGVELRVSDTGIGIGPEEKVKIFERFHRGRASGTAGEKGTGLGLAICREIVQLHGGALEAESNPGGGTVFTAWFPVAEA
jgi:signal transduction histidine kinase